MRRIRRSLLLVSFNALLLLLLLEIAGAVTFYVEQGRLFYRRAAAEPSPPAAAEEPTIAQLHPVLGFIRRPGLPVTRIAPRERMDRLYGTGSAPPWNASKANNFGFFSDHDYPHLPPDEPFLIGVFGGSVAQWFALQGERVLVDRLRRLPELRNRRIEVLSFAQSSFKQPQQLQILAYFLSLGQPLDFVLNLDGFNEVALAGLNVKDGLDPSLPSSRVLLPLAALLDGAALSPDQAEALAWAKRTAAKLESAELRAGRSRSAGAWLVLDLQRRLAARRESAASLELAASMRQVDPDLMYLNRWRNGDEPAETLEVLRSIWSRASTLMDGMLRSRGVPYLHVVQPNLYVSRKTLTAEERRLTARSETSFAQSVRAGYPRLLESAREMQAQGVPVVSAVDLFDANRETIYADRCCHLNQLGNEILAGFIADHMAGLIAAQPPGPPSPGSRANLPRPADDHRGPRRR